MSDREDLITATRCFLSGLVFLVVTACSAGGGGNQEAPTPVILVESPPVAVLLSPTSVSPVETATIEIPTNSTPSPPQTGTPLADSQRTPVRPTPFPTVEVDLPDFPLSRANVEQCRITGELGRNGQFNQGTAPAPTPTPKPADGSRQPSVVEKELTELLGEVGPAIGALVDYNTAFQSAWAYADTAEKQAGQLHVFGNRLSQLCSAVSQLTIPPEVFGEVVGLTESIRARYQWVALALDELICCDTAQTAFLDVGFISTSDAVTMAASSLLEILEARLAVEEVSSTRIVVSDRFGFSLSIGDDAILVRNTVDLLVVFPDRSEILDPESLGPEPWHDGTAIKIRRLRNRSELAVEQAVLEYGGLLTRFGEADQRTKVDIQGLDAIQLSYPPLENAWVGSVLVFVWEGNTYFVELMCQQGAKDLCDSARAVVESLHFES